MINFHRAYMIDQRQKMYSAEEKLEPGTPGVSYASTGYWLGQVVDVSGSSLFRASSFEDYSVNWDDYSFGYLAED